MLSLPGIKGIFKSLDGRKQHQGGTSATLGSDLPREGDRAAYLVWLATRLQLEVLAVVEVEGTAGAIVVGGKNGLASTLTMHLLEEGGPLSSLIRKCKAVFGNAKVFASTEVFPCDGNWCDLVPMDSTVAFSFVPLRGLPLPKAKTGVADGCDAFVLAVDSATEGTHRVLELKAFLAASLLQLADWNQRDARREALLSCLTRFLADEGCSICVADGKGHLTQIGGDNPWPQDSQDLAEVAREIEALEGNLEPNGPAVEIIPQERGDQKITVFALSTDQGGADWLLISKRVGERVDARSRREWLNLLGRFTSSIAHEIKNPLTGIAAGVQYLAKHLQPGVTEADTVDFILAEIARLNRIVDDLYKIARPPHLVLSKTSLNEVITKSLFCLGEEVVKKRLSVEQKLQPDLPLLDADPERLQQVMINIIKNGIEACKESTKLEIVTLADDKRVIATVTDSGPGIPPGERARVFEPFFSTKKGGTGLGLYISQAIVEEHGGTIGIESPPGVGARFIIEIPLFKPQGI